MVGVDAYESKEEGSGDDVEHCNIFVTYRNSQKDADELRSKFALNARYITWLEDLAASDDIESQIECMIQYKQARDEVR